MRRPALMRLTPRTDVRSDGRKDLTTRLAVELHSQISLFIALEPKSPRNKKGTKYYSLLANMLNVNFIWLIIDSIYRLENLIFGRKFISQNREYTFISISGYLVRSVDKIHSSINFPLKCSQNTSTKCWLLLEMQNFGYSFEYLLRQLCWLQIRYIHLQLICLSRSPNVLVSPDRLEYLEIESIGVWDTLPKKGKAIILLLGVAVEDDVDEWQVQLPGGILVLFDRQIVVVYPRWASEVGKDPRMLLCLIRVTGRAGQEQAQIPLRMLFNEQGASVEKGVWVEMFWDDTQVQDSWAAYERAQLLAYFYVVEAWASIDVDAEGWYLRHWGQLLVSCCWMGEVIKVFWYDGCRNCSSGRSRRL